MSDAPNPWEHNLIIDDLWLMIDCSKNDEKWKKMKDERKKNDEKILAFLSANAQLLLMPNYC